MANKWTSIEMKQRYFDPARQNLGYMMIYGLAVMGDQDNIPLSIQTCSLPNFSHDEIEIPFGNDKFYVAGRSNLETFSVTFVDFMNTRIVEALYDWKVSQYDPVTGTLGLAREYKKSADIVQLTPKGEEYRTWNIEGLWIQSMNHGTLDMTGTDKLTLDITFRADSCRLAGR